MRVGYERAALFEQRAGSLPEWIAIPRVRTNDGVKRAIEVEMIATQEDAVSTDVLATRVTDGIAVITLGSPKRIYFDAEMGDALTAALDGYAGDSNIRAVVLTGGAPGYFARHSSITALLQLAEPLRASGREWPDNATYNAGFFDKAMALCESMPKPVVAAISGTCLAGAFEFALSCDLRIAEEGDYLIGLPETNLGLVPGAGGTQRLPRTIGMAAALMHILIGDAVNPKEAARLGLVHESVSAKALERNLFLKLCISDAGLARMRSYEAANITSPARSIEVDERKVNRG